MSEDVTNQSKEIGGRSTAPPWNGYLVPVALVSFMILVAVIGLVIAPVIPFAIATVIFSYLTYPVTEFIDRRITFGRRGISVLLTYLLILVVIVVTTFGVLTPLVGQTFSALQSLASATNTLITEPIIFDDNTFLLPNPETGEAESIVAFIERTIDEEATNVDSELGLGDLNAALNINQETLTQLFNLGGSITTGILGSVLGLAGSTIGFLLNLLFFLTISATMLSNGQTMVAGVVGLAPNDYQDDMARLLRDLGGVWDGYVRGNLTLGVIMGVAMWLLATALGLPNPLFLAVVAGLMEFVPNVGPVIAMVVAGIFALLSGSGTFPAMNNFTVLGIVIVIWFIMQQLEATVLVPRIVGENLNLHPAIVILAVIWGGSFGGLLGVVIAPPIVASARIILQYIYGRLTDRAAFNMKGEESNITTTQSWQQLRRFFNNTREAVSHLQNR